MIAHFTGLVQALQYSVTGLDYIYGAQDGKDK
jgi:hypothetical protein